VSNVCYCLLNVGMTMSGRSCQIWPPLAPAENRALMIGGASPRKKEESKVHH
jgi:hypothetical protein